MSGKTFIHINGQEYDASSGNLTPIHPVKPVQTIDGFIGNSQPRATVQRQPAPPVLRHPKKAQTLSRAAVHKPTMMSDIGPRPVAQVVAMKPVAPAVQHESVEKSPLITKFPASGPEEHSQHAHTSLPPKPPLREYELPSYSPKTKREMLIDKQLQKASAHNEEEHKVKKLRVRSRLAAMTPARRRVVTVGASAVAVLLITAFVLYNNLPGISLTIASRRAGFSAMLPTYTPNGYSLKGPVNYGPGRIVLSFNSNTNDRTFQIEQTPSAWSTDTLRDQVSSTSGNQYQTFQLKGLTIFFTNNNSATWVDKGVLFSLKGDSGLSSDQIASIAASM